MGNIPVADLLKTVEQLTAMLILFKGQLQRLDTENSAKVPKNHAD